MARKPKTARSNEFAVSPEEVLAVLNDAPAPVRRGRKAKAAASPEPLAMMDSDDAMGGTADADGTIADPVAPSVRKRPGPKPKQRTGAARAAPFQDNADATSEGEAQAPDAAPQPMSATNGRPDAEAGGQQGQQERVLGIEPTTSETSFASAAPDAASSGSSENAATSVQPVAQWDRATDTVQFDWTEIERTASQGGPNQVMAKLLVAARAEGGNSRWPL